MKTYKLTPEFYKQMNRRIWVIGIVLCVLVLPVGYYLGTGGIVSWSTIAVFPILIFAGIYGLLRGQKQQKKLYESYKLIFDGDNIKRIQDDIQDITFSLSAISKVTEVPGRGMTITAINKNLIIEIPATIEKYQEVRSLVEEKHLIESKTTFLDLQAPAMLIILILLVAGFFFGTMFSTNTYVVIILGSLLLIMLVASIIITLVNANAPKNTKRKIWIAILPILAVLAKIITVVGGNQ